MIYLIRHALDDERYVGSWSNVSILESEKEKVKSQAKYIKENLQVTDIYTSDIKRSVQTAEIIGKYLNKEVIKDKNLREQNKGYLTGKEKAKLSKEELEQLNNQKIDTIFEGGESLEEVYKRIKRYIPTLAKLKDNTLIVTHRGVINMLYYIMNDIPLDMQKKRFNVKHLSIHELDIDKKMIRRIK